MGGQTNQASIATSIISQAQQTVNNYCSITCSNNFSNNTITIIGGNATINVDQTCTNIGSECTIKNLISSQIDNLIQNIIQQTQSNLGLFSLLGPGQTNSTNIGNAIKNQITQLINNTCNQNATNNINAVNVLAIDADTNINYVQTGSNDHATCALDTVAKLVLNNDVQNSVKQAQSSCGNILGILIVVAIIILVILLFPVLSRLIGGIGGGNKGANINITASAPTRPRPTPAPVQAPAPVQVIEVPAPVQAPVQVIEAPVPAPAPELQLSNNQPVIGTSNVYNDTETRIYPSKRAGLQPITKEEAIQYLNTQNIPSTIDDLIKLTGPIGGIDCTNPFNSGCPGNPTCSDGRRVLPCASTKLNDQFINTQLTGYKYDLLDKRFGDRDLSSITVTSSRIY